jgi:hypothetical protein
MSCQKFMNFNRTDGRTYMFHVFSLVQLMTSPFKASNNGAKTGLNNGHLSKKCIRFSSSVLQRGQFGVMHRIEELSRNLCYALATRQKVANHGQSECKSLYEVRRVTAC